MVILITILYSLSLLYIFLFSLSQLHLTFLYRRRNSKITHTPSSGDDWEMVTVQLPVYNEQHVIERLLDAVTGLDYPAERLEIQVLDDSNDRTTDLIRRKINSLNRANIHHIRRPSREGFKAGALQYGLASAKGKFIAIFDADFIPQKDFLKKTLPYFQHPKTGAVQTRWGHLNTNYSLLTALQAFGLDAHFSVEQSARNVAGSFINFNGTCGVWRKSCIEDAGGWSADTLTEDLDLSYRAQLKGWKFIYVEDIVTPGELPIVMQAIKSQQYRWNKGGAETARKIFGSVLRADLPFINKVHAFFHLFNSSVFVALLFAAVTSIPMLFLKTRHPELNGLFQLGVVFLAGFMSISFFYWTSTTAFYLHPAKTFFSLFPRFLIVSMGLSLHNGIAVLEGLFGIKTPFVRTPKFNVVSRADQWKSSSYLVNKFSWLTLLEGLFCLYFIFGIAAGIYLHDRALLIFHIMLTLGFGFVFYQSVRPLRHV